MPPKRKVSSSVPLRKSKRVKTTNDSTAEELKAHPSGRPKRASTGKPQYNLNRSYAKKPAYDILKGDTGHTGKTPKSNGARKRGRPPKATPPTRIQGQSKKVENQSDNAALLEASKASQASQVPPITKAQPASKRGRPSKTTSAKLSAPKATQTSTIVQPAVTTSTPGMNAPKHRGRPPKARLDPPNPLLRSLHDPGADEDDIETDAESSEAQYWLMKAEPNDRFEKGVNVKFSIDDLAAAAEPEPWDGVRNYVARNNMRVMRKNDLAFFYHSNCPIPGIVGVMRIVREHSIDESAFDPQHPYFDEKSTRDKPKWEVVHVEFVKKFDMQITLKMLNDNAATTGELANMQVLKQKRLSVNQVSPNEWRFILEMAGESPNVGVLSTDALKDGYESGSESEGSAAAGLAEKENVYDDGEEVLGVGISDKPGTSDVVDSIEEDLTV